MVESKIVDAVVVDAEKAKAALSVVPQSQGLVARPVVSPAEAATIMAEYEALKKAIATESDIRREKRKQKQADGSYKEVEVAYLKKSYWRKAAVFFSLTVEPMPGTEKLHIEGGIKVASVTYIAKAPNGRFMAGDGHCGNDEGGKGYWPTSSLISTAHTRAANRAISNLIGGGEVSAEEVEQEPESQPKSEDIKIDLITELNEAKTQADLDTVKAQLLKAKKHLTPEHLAEVYKAGELAKAAIEKGAK